MVNYPAKINNYSITVSNTDASIRLRGEKDQLIGDIQFSTNQSQDNPTKAFINRGGFISTTYPLGQLPSILALLQQEDMLLIEENGDFTNVIKQ
jgi:hypothetical protein